MKTQTKTDGQTSTGSAGVTETQKYIEAWNNHVKTLGRLKWNLNAKEDINKLDKIQEELNDLIAVAAKELTAARKEAQQ